MHFAVYFVGLGGQIKILNILVWFIEHDPFAAHHASMLVIMNYPE